MARLTVFALLCCSLVSAQDLAVHGETVHTMAGDAITNGVVLIRDGKIAEVGLAGEIEIPAGFRTLEAKVVTPGLIDAHTVVGIAGYLNQSHDQEQIERSAAIQPDLRAVDAYDARERLIEWVREFGVTTIHTGHGPGALVSGQTMIAKTRGRTVDEALVKPFAMLAVTIGDSARGRDNKSPGTRAKMAAMLRAELLKAQAYARERESADEDKKPDRDLELEVLASVLAGEIPLLVTAQRSRDILTALRIADELDLEIVLDGAAESYEVLDQIREAGVPVIVHPTMYRARAETENLSFETASKLVAAGIPTALQSGFEGYVPKTRVVLLEAGMAAAHGLGFEQALGAITLEAAKILGINDRVGSIEPGKDGDLALYDGDPFEYATHCVGVVIEGEVVSETVR